MMQQIISSCDPTTICNEKKVLKYIPMVLSFLWKKISIYVYSERKFYIYKWRRISATSILYIFVIRDENLIKLQWCSCCLAIREEKKLFQSKWNMPLILELSLLRIISYVVKKPFVAFFFARLPFSAFLAILYTKLLVSFTMIRMIMWDELFSTYVSVFSFFGGASKLQQFCYAQCTYTAQEHHFLGAELFLLIRRKFRPVAHKFNRTYVIHLFSGSIISKCYI